MVPGISDTIIRSSRSSRLTSDDLPALGRPTIATAVSSRSGSTSAVTRAGASARQPLDDLVHQLADALPVLGADLDDRVEAEPVQLERPAARAPIVGLVDRQDRRRRPRPDGGGNVLVAGHQPLAAVDDEHDEVRRPQRAPAALDHQLVQRILAGAEHPAGVGQLERPILASDRMRDDVPGGARDGRHDGAPGPGQPIEQRGLTDVGPADEHHRGEARRSATKVAPILQVHKDLRFDRRKCHRNKIVTAIEERPDGMIKVDIVNEVSRVAEITKVKAELAVDAVFEAMRHSMQRGERIELRGFGVFQVKPRKRGIGRNPRTGKEVRIPPGRTIRFKPGKELQNIG